MCAYHVLSHRFINVDDHINIDFYLSLFVLGGIWGYGQLCVIMLLKLEWSRIKREKQFHVKLTCEDTQSYEQRLDMEIKFRFAVNI